ncbi:hypothetical protein Ms3S1_27590 [Methylosinus sp. 3S-1]|uniref:DUF1353 domain-containing protein n=2 Tax=Methylocystaceae TaxID=31993 RepID=A0A2D2D1K1_METT3|nr:DUF1353 domain-containing protein [Methylosinus trichosporium OB3b]
MRAAIADINGHNEKIDRDLARAVKETGKAPLFVKIPKVTPFIDWDYYFLEDNLEWIPNQGQNFSAVEVPKGFVTDLASVPAVLWSIFPKTGRYAYAAIAHDYLYWTQTVPREEADSVLKAAMEDAKVDPVSAVSFYAAVRTFGASPWEHNRKAREAGEARVLVEFPSDRLISWETWRKRPGVFGQR